MGAQGNEGAPAGDGGDSLERLCDVLPRPFAALREAMIAFNWTSGNPDATKEGSTMKRGNLPVALAISCVALSASGARACLGPGAKEFHLAICEHYHVPEATVIVVRKDLPDDDLPVVFFIAERAHVAPESVVALRARGMSWMDVSLHYKLTAEVFHVHFVRDPGPPYGVAYGYYKNRKQSEWGAIRLADADVVHLVNVKFLAERHGCTPDEVVSFHAQGKGYVDVHVDMKAKLGKAGHSAAPGDGAPGKGGNGAAAKEANGKGPPVAGGPSKPDAGRAPGKGGGGGKGRGR